MSLPTIDLARVRVRREGDLTIVSGPEGCGKTTLIKGLIAHFGPDGAHWCRRGDGSRLFQMMSGKPAHVAAVVFEDSINIRAFMERFPGLPVIVEELTDD